MTDQPVGDLIKSITDDVKQLVRDEVALAKAELIPAAKNGGIGAGLFAGAGYFVSRDTTGQTQYSRVGLYSVMSMTERIKDMTVSMAPEAEIGAVAREEGMCTLREDGLAKVRSGLTSLEEVLRVTA